MERWLCCQDEEEESCSSWIKKKGVMPMVWFPVICWAGEWEVGRRARLSGDCSRVTGTWAHDILPPACEGVKSSTLKGRKKSKCFPVILVHVLVRGIWKVLSKHCGGREGRKEGAPPHPVSSEHCLGTPWHGCGWETWP